jgi:hypothetical protein
MTEFSCRKFMNFERLEVAKLALIRARELLKICSYFAALRCILGRA